MLFTISVSVLFAPVNFFSVLDFVPILCTQCRTRRSTNTSYSKNRNAD